jgi:hypothetical protein
VFEVEDKRLGSMAHPHQPYWLWSGGISITLGAALVGVAGALDAARIHFSFWTSPITISAYAASSIALICLACAIREKRFPFAAKNLQPREIKGGERSPDIRPYSGIRPDHGTGAGAQANSTRLEPNGRIFVEDSPKKLIAISKKHTSAQAQKLLKPYYYRWIRVSGRLGDVGAWTGSNSTVIFQPSFHAPAVSMIFTDRDVFDKSLSILSAGTRITAIGQIERIDSTSVQITNCEIESVGR